MDHICYKSERGYFYERKDNVTSRISEDLYMSRTNLRAQQQIHPRHHHLLNNLQVEQALVKRYHNKKRRHSRPKSGNRPITKEKPEVGDIVQIIVKPYEKNKLVIGKVMRVLTKKQFHSRGLKLMLEDGTVGRLIKILEKKK